MADTVTIDVAAGGTAVVSTDQLTIDGIAQHCERIKVALGANNVYQKDLAAGQSNMAGSVPVVVASDQSLVPVQLVDAFNQRGSISSLAVGDTASVAFVLTDAVYRFRGFLGTGTGDAKWVVKYNADVRYALQTNVVNPNAYLVLPNGDVPGASVIVSVEVTNNGTGAADFEATLFGE